MGKSLYMDNNVYSGGNATYAYIWNNWYSDPSGHYEREYPPWNGADGNYAFAPSDISFEMWIKSVPDFSRVSTR